VQQANSELRDLRLWGLDINTAGHVGINGTDCVDLAERFGTPLLVVNQSRLEVDVRSIQEAMSQAPSGSKVLYSYKTNCIPGILKAVHKLGVGSEVISPYELWLAERLGVPGGEVVYNGVYKSEESLKLAIQMDVLSINVDHMEEIEKIHCQARNLGRRARVGIRLALLKHSQFGLEVDSGEALEAVHRIVSRSDHLDLVCIHFNVTSNAKSSSTHLRCALKALEFMKTLKQELGIQVPYLDIGGGFGVPTTKNMSGKEYGLYRLTGCLPCPPSPQDFQPIHLMMKEIVSGVCNYCNEHGVDVRRILIEPGRFVTSRAEFLLVRVNAIKTKCDGTRFAMSDAGRLSLTFPMDFEYHEMFLANRPEAALEATYHVMGRICTSADWMAKNRLLPELKPGDIVMVMDAGAYFSSYSSNFAFPRPPIVMVDKEEVRVTRRAESFEHMTAMDRPD